MIKAAKLMDVPVIATEQNPKGASILPFPFSSWPDSLPIVQSANVTDTFASRAPTTEPTRAENRTRSTRSDRALAAA